MHRVAQLAARQHNVVGYEQLRRCGLSKWQIPRWVNAKVLHRVFPRAYAVGSPKITLLGRVKAAVLACGDDSFASHRTAAWIWALGISMRGIEVTVAREDAPAIKGIKTRKSSFAPGETTRRHGIPVTSLIRTLIDLAAVLDENSLAYALDQAGRHNLSIPRLREAIERHKGRTGIAKLRRVVDEYYPTKPVNSKLEWLARNFCRRENLPRAQVNALIETDDGFREGDLVFAQAKVILEIQSKEHHGSWQARIRDNRRAAELAVDDWLVLQATKDDLKPGEHSRILGERLAKIIKRRTPRPAARATPHR
jgi:hypothetical protein